MPQKFAINGRIFEFQITGVGRFCYETILEMDQLLPKEKCVLLVPQDAKNIPKLSNIEVKHIGKKTGIYWEQVELPIYLRRNNLTCLSMSSSIPIIKPGFALIHDISLKVNKNMTTSIKDKVKIWWPRLQYRTAAHRAKILFTDTEFQRNEFVREYGISGENIRVVYAGWQHMKKIVSDTGILTKLSLQAGHYMYAVSTRAKNKNFKWIYNLALKNPTIKFVVSGKLDTKFLSDDTELSGVKNIITTGYVTDEEMKALMENAEAFLYPSFYEGFGIPPMEALSVGTKAVVSRSSCLPEVYGGTVYYIDPYNSDIDLLSLLRQDVQKASVVLDKYSWKKTAEYILEAIEKFYMDY